MTSRANAEHYFYLSALVALQSPLQLRTAVLSEVTLDSYIREHAAVITIWPPRSLSVEGLLVGFLEASELFSSIAESGEEILHWQCYGYEPKTKSLEVQALLTTNQLRERAAKMAAEAKTRDVPRPISVFVPQSTWAKKHSDAVRAALHAVILKSVTEESDRVSIGEVAASTHAAEASDREKLIRIRGEMLEQVGAYTSEELAAAAASVTSNSSQFALDQRSTGKIFGVRYGRAWRYPKFQFDSKRRPYPEMKAIIEALPDEQGWGRIQWFLEPNAKLQGRSPLEVWMTDREKVVAIADRERWNARL